MINYISDNLNSAPITEIAISENTHCPDGYTLQKLGVWAAVTNGCYCPDLDIVYSGVCKKEDQKKCEGIASQYPKTIFKWNDDYYCIKRAVNYAIKPYSNLCPASYVDCGVFCMREDEKCPITNITVVPEVDVSIYEMLQLSNDRTMIIIRNTSSRSTIYNIEVGLYDIPCLDTTRLPTDQYAVYPALDFQDRLGCGTYGNDNSSKILESMSLKELFDDNEINAFEKLPLYDKYEGLSQAYFVSRPRRWVLNSRACKSIDFTRMKDLADEVTTFRNSLLAGTFFLLVLVVIFWLYVMYITCEGGIKNMTKSMTRNWVAWGGFTVCLLAIISYSNHLVKENQGIVDQRNFFSQVGGMNCFENKNITLAFKDFANNIPTGSDTTIIYSRIMMWASIFFYFATLILTSYKVVYDTCCN